MISVRLPPTASQLGAEVIDAYTRAHFGNRLKLTLGDV
jgi:hypothetical protein